MRDVIVAIKVPESLLDELKKSARERHFMDLSEEIRSIVRQKWLQYNDPEIMRMRKLKQEIRQEIEKKSEAMARERVLSELEDIKKKVQKSK